MKVGVREGSGDPAYRWSVWIVDVALDEAKALLTRDQYDAVALQVKTLARQDDPTHSQTVDVRAIEDYHEIRTKGGVLRKLNVRVFYAIDKEHRGIIVLGVINKKNDGQTPQAVKLRIRRRLRMYSAGDLGPLPE